MAGVGLIARRRYPPRVTTPRRLLAAAGLPPDASIRALPREDRTAYFLGGAHIGWIADSDRGRARLARERQVLRLIAARCRFPAPRVLWVAPDGGAEVRARLPGDRDPAELSRAARRDPDLAEAIGAWLGGALAEQHQAFTREDVPDLPARPEWPLPPAWILGALPPVVARPALAARAAALLARHDALPVDPALVHGDVGFHNLAVEGREVRGIYDYDGAAWADRHVDFRYLLYAPGRLELLDAARGVYEPACGVRLSLGRLRLMNAACALSFLAWRRDTPPGARSCGRTLAQDMAWTRQALGDARG